jgi:negative regulator of sigma E activity
MKRLCRELERHLESGAEHLPDALGAHLGECVKCQRAWRLHQAYQRALHAARGEPTPACEMPWSRIQAQLAARAVSRRLFAWLRPALAWGTAVAVVLAVGAVLFPLSARQPSQGESLAQQPVRVQTAQKPESVSATTLEASTPSAVEPTPPPARTVAQATPHMREYTRLQPPASENLPTGAHAARLRNPEVLERRPIDEALRAPTLGSASESPFTVASLPLTPFGVGDSAAGVEYLPISYGSPSSYHEGSNNEAIVGSF